VKSALIRYRVMAWVVGVMLLLVVAATLVKYVGDDPKWIERVGPVHGFLYVVYLVATIDLAFRARWSGMKTVGVCLAGTIPFLSFVAEHRINQQVSASMDQAPEPT
jgi:integral membrane protein